MSDINTAISDALIDTLLHGHGFIRISNNNGIEAHRIKYTEFDEIKELFDWIKKHSVEAHNE